MAVYTPEPKSIYDLLSDTTYSIPIYQRPYKWNDEHLERLWDNLIESYDSYKQDENKSEYFLGTIVVVGDESKKERDVIDGQQRLTTLYIMTTILKICFPSINEKSESDNAINLNALNSMLKNRFDKPNIKTRKKDIAYFDSLVINAKIDDIKNYKFTKKELKNEDPIANYKNSMLFFYNKFIEFYNSHSDELDTFVNYIYNNVVIIRISCLDANSALKVFQTINDTGLDLSIADIIKSSFMSELDVDSPFDTYWDSITKQINDDGISIDQFLIYYLYYKTETNPKKGSTAEYADIIKKCKLNRVHNENIKNDVNYEMLKKETLDDIVNDIKIFADKFHTIYTKENDLIYSLKYLSWDSYINSVLATIEKHVLENDKDKYLKLIRRFYYLYYIAGKTLTSIKQTSFNIIKYIKHNTYDELKKLLDEKIESDRVVEKAKENLNSDDVFNEKWLKPIMLSFDYTLTDCINVFVPIDSRLNVDHIIPKEWKGNDWWRNQLSNDKDKIDLKLYSIGNMALLSEHKNKVAQNVGLDVKQYIYLGQSIVPDNEGNHKQEEGITGFESTRYVINELFKRDSLWNMDKLEMRAEYLLDGIYSLLEIL